MKELQLSHKTNIHRMQDISNNINDQLIQNLKNYKYLSSALDEQWDIGDTIKFILQACIVLKDFQIYDKKLSIQTYGVDILTFTCVKQAFQLDNEENFLLS